MSHDFEPNGSGHDGSIHGVYLEALAWANLITFLHEHEDEARKKFVENAPPDESGLFDKVLKEINAGFAPERGNLEMFFSYTRILHGFVYDPYTRTTRENDTGFID